jgi:hypothetical protein
VNKYISIGILLVLVGCTSAPPYVQQGIALNNRQSYSIISTESDETTSHLLKHVDRKIWIVELDGKSTSNLLYSPSHPEVIKVEPGKHQIKVTYNYHFVYARGCIVFEAKAGKDYIVRRKLGQYEVSFWLEEVSNGNVVGNLCGLENEPS